MKDNEGFREEVGRIAELVHEIESVADPALRATAKELVQCVMDLHAAGIERMLEIVSKAGESGERIIQSLGRDDLVSSLLVLYNLHPEDFETRVNRGVEKARHLLARRGATLDVLAIGGGAVRLQFNMQGHSCGSTANEIQSTIRESLSETAPDAVDIQIEAPPEQPESGFVPLAKLQSAVALNQP